MKLGITGHQRLDSAESWKWVRQQLTELMQGQTAAEVDAYSSLAIGADQEFASAALEHGARLHAIVPCCGYEGTFKTLGDLSRYKYLISKASSVDLLDYSQPSEEAFMAAGKKIVDKVDLLIAVWNGEEAAGTGGTDDAVAYALSRGTPVRHINPVTKTVALLPTSGRAT